MKDNNVLTPIKAIRTKCLECSAGQYKEVLLCPIKDCALYLYRLGCRPTNEKYKKAELAVDKSTKTGESENG